jgi:hypothetical protein
MALNAHRVKARLWRNVEYTSKELYYLPWRPDGEKGAQQRRELTQRRGGAE